MVNSPCKPLWGWTWLRGYGEALPPGVTPSLFISFRLVLFIFTPSRSFVRDIMCVKYRLFLPTPPSSWALLENTSLPYEEGKAIHACPRWEFFLPHFLHVAVVLRSLSTFLISLIKEDISQTINYEKLLKWWCDRIIEERVVELTFEQLIIKCYWHVNFTFKWAKSLSAKLCLQWSNLLRL